MHDEFRTDSTPSYSKTEFYVTASDRKGHGQKTQLSVPPEIKGQISALVASKSIPWYRTEEDFARDAIVHRLHDLSEILHGTAPVMSGEIEMIYKKLMVEAHAEMKLRMAEAEQRLFDRGMDLLRLCDPQNVSILDEIMSVLVNPDLRDRLEAEIARKLR